MFAEASRLWWSSWNNFFGARIKAWILGTVENWHEIFSCHVLRWKVAYQKNLERVSATTSNQGLLHYHPIGGQSHWNEAFTPLSPPVKSSTSDARDERAVQPRVTDHLSKPILEISSRISAVWIIVRIGLQFSVHSLRGQLKLPGSGWLGMRSLMLTSWQPLGSWISGAIGDMGDMSVLAAGSVTSLRRRVSRLGAPQI